MSNIISSVLKLPGREIFLINRQLGDNSAASFFISDADAGGILVNAPAFSLALIKQLEALADINFLFLPSVFGAKDLEQWHENVSPEILCHENEERYIDFSPLTVVNNKTKLTRTIEFVTLPGRTQGTCALYLKNKPGVLFLGPAMSCNETFWPVIESNEDDFDYENRLLSALNIKNLKYAYAFCDDFNLGFSSFGPNACEEIKKYIESIFD